MTEIKNLKKAFDKNVVFDGLSLALPERGVFALKGPSGCGKTTLLRIISGLDRDYEGTVECGGRISYVFQENRLIPTLTAFENVNIVCHDEGKTRNLLDRVKLSDSIDKYPGELSGGMNRRVAIARALAYDHEILLLDEPFTALDEEVKADVTALIKELESDRLVIMVTHDPDEASAMGAEVIELTSCARINL